MKQCIVCNENKDLTDFDLIRSKKENTKLSNRCKACRREYMRKYQKANRKKFCKTEMSREEWLNSVRKPHLSSEEKQKLAQAKWDAWYKKTLQEEEQKREDLLAGGYKHCSMCKEEKHVSQFHMRTRTRKSGTKYQSPYAHCKTCRRTDNRKHELTPTGKATKKRNRALRDKRSKQATPSWLTPEQKQQIVDTYEHMRDCRAVTGEDYHVDHIVPLRGETVCGLHVPWNLQVMPAHVNMSKSNSLDDTPYGPLE